MNGINVSCNPTLPESKQKQTIEVAKVWHIFRSSKDLGEFAELLSKEISNEI